MWIVIPVLLIFCGVAMAQEAPRAEMFGGYQYLRTDTGISGINHFNLNGWNASVSGFFNDYIGGQADFSGSYGTPDILGTGVKTRLHTFMFGPVLRYPNTSKFTPFAHAVFGAGHISGDILGFNASETDFTWAVGGGLDVSVHKNFGLRLAQADFLQTRALSEHQNHFRYSAGIVLKF